MLFKLATTQFYDAEITLYHSLVQSGMRNDIQPALTYTGSTVLANGEGLHLVQ